MKRLLATGLLLVSALASAQAVTLPEPQIVELENGATFIVHQKRDVPLVGISAIVRGGAVTDPEGKAGLASLLASMLEKGAGERDAAAFAETVDAAGATLSTRVGLESITISGEFLSKDVGLAVELLTDMLRAPALDRSEFVKLRDRQIDLISAAKDTNLPGLLPLYGAAWLFADHPYGTAVDGDETSLANIAHRDLNGFYEDFVGADRLVISVVGDIDAPNRLKGLTRDDWLLSHCVHLPTDHHLRGTILHNPMSNLNNAVGYAGPARFKNPVALGTDGIGGNVIEAFRLAYVLQRSVDVTCGPDTAWGWLETGWDLVPEAREDEVTWSYDPMDPWHIAFTPVNTAAAVVRDAHLAARDYFVSVEHPGMGALRYPGPAYRHSATPWRIAAPAPAVSLLVWLAQRDRSPYCAFQALQAATFGSRSAMPASTVATSPSDCRPKNASVVACLIAISRTCGLASRPSATTARSSASPTS